MDWIQVLGLAAGICTSSSMLPQLIKTAKEKKAEEVSIWMLLILLVGVCGWIAYGLLRKDMPIIVTNAFSLLLNVVMIVLRVKYGGEKRTDRSPAYE